MTNVIIGIIGAGHLGASLVRGLRRANVPGGNLLVAPRGDGPAALARDTGSTLATDAADLVRRSDIVLVCVRPDQVEPALDGLPWRDNQTVVSTLAAVPLAVISAIVAPARAVRAMPMTAAAICASPTAFYPGTSDMSDFLALLGPAFAVSREEDLEVSTAGSLLYALSHFAVETTADWLVGKGFTEQSARQHAVAHLAAAAAMMAADDHSSLATLATSGGVTEAAMACANGEGLSTAWAAAFHSAHFRILEMSRREDAAPGGATDL